MSNGKPQARRIPNKALALGAMAFMVIGAVSLVAGDRSLAISTFAGAGICLSLLNFSYPSLSLPLKVLVTPILLLPFAAMGAVVFGLI